MYKVHYSTAPVADKLYIKLISSKYEIYRKYITLWPFGHNIIPGANDTGCLSILMNIIWIICGGIEIAILHVWFGIIFCITIIGIPFGLQHFKMALLALAPFGKQIS